MRTQLLAVVLVLACALLGEASGQSVNNRPVIGILTLPCTDSSFCDSQRTSYFPASYVKWVEAGGAQGASLLPPSSSFLFSLVFRSRVNYFSTPSCPRALPIERD